MQETMLSRKIYDASLSAFTLIELSIVLVIIGLIVGGVLVGQDLIKAAAVRAQVSQIERFNSAVNTFRGKFNNYLPGDIPEPDATRFGLAARGQYAGQGDGNGILEGHNGGAPGNCGICLSIGETALFWVDLGTVKLIDGSFSVASASSWVNPTGGSSPGFITSNSTPPLTALMPNAKISENNIYVYSAGNFVSGNTGTWLSNGINYFGISRITGMGTYAPSSSPVLTTKQAFNIDIKIDDGIPQTGKVIAQYIDYAATTGNSHIWAGASGTVATAGSSTTCYDNGNSAGATQQYSITQNNGNGPNCALSFKFQ